MIQEIAPHIYHNQFTPRDIRPDDFVFVFSKEGVLGRLEENTLVLPTLADLGEAFASSYYLFAIDDTAYYLFEGEAPAPFGGWAYLPTKPLRNCTPDEHLFAMGAAESLWRWYSSNRFCGRCGAPMVHYSKERCQACPQCGKHVYPKIMPGIIAAVYDGDRLVMTRYRGRPHIHYALVAGFNEIGESLEETVRREVLEEVGLHVGKLTFYKSQPWIFTDSLLVGFFAQLEGSDKITLQEDELSEGQWFHRSELPDDHSHISLTGEMIEYFREHGAPDL